MSDIKQVSDTAFWIASHRARETKRPDALFKDPLAEVLAGEHGEKIAANMPSPQMTSWNVAMRTVIIDDFISKAVAEGFDTVLNLGAGLDTRPYRLKVPSALKWIEVDFPHVIQFKTEKLKNEKPVCDLRRLSADLSNAEVRKNVLAEISQQSKKVLVLTEGVTPYLSNEDVAALAQDLKSQKNFLYWIVDYYSPETLRFRKKLSKKMPHTPFLFRPENWWQFFKDNGWQPKEISYLVEEGMRRGRNMPFSWFFRKIIIPIALKLTPKERRDDFKKSLAFVLLEPIN